MLTDTRKGARVVMSAEGLRALRPKKPNRRGTVVGKSRRNGLTLVTWDDNRPSSKTAYAVSFLDEAGPE